MGNREKFIWCESGDTHCVSTPRHLKTASPFIVLHKGTMAADAHNSVCAFLLFFFSSSPICDWFKQQS